MTLNMIVASLLLQSQKATINFQVIYASVKKIQNYLIVRQGVKTVMREVPTRHNVIDTIRKLGFQVTENTDKQRKSRVKNFTINMDAKRDQKTLLGLSYYSNNLTQNLVMDSCVSMLLLKNAKNDNNQPIEVGRFIEGCKFLAKILRNEYLLRDPRGFPETVHHRINVLEQFKEINRSMSPTEMI